MKRTIIQTHSVGAEERYEKKSATKPLKKIVQTFSKHESILDLEYLRHARILCG